MERWICCGHDINELCRRAGCALPALCFFCGEPRKMVSLSSQPEDWLAFELAELWSGKIREWHGDPESHAPSLDQYGRLDVEAWRAVARRVFDLVDSWPGITPDSQATRDGLIHAMQAYAEEWKTGKSLMHSAGKTDLCIALDRHEFEVAKKTLLDLVKRLKRGS